eukprot:TRINITY_DN728_c0_g1_i1.p1 TRINITY_DN728_c0_g1~~TRINITY_DN728_c0_g1_i1.p1  ORF type:complete len:129 (+),score=26.53 TRINITY_DN728_c0_g1_i1:96-482(+)
MPKVKEYADDSESDYSEEEESTSEEEDLKAKKRPVTGLKNFGAYLVPGVFRNRFHTVLTNTFKFAFIGFKIGSNLIWILSTAAFLLIFPLKRALVNGEQAMEELRQNPELASQIGLPDGGLDIDIDVE